jgi:hypothetical protein
MLSSTYASLHRATDRWKELWDYVQERDGCRTQLIGFAKYGLELWWLARKLLEVAQRGEIGTAYIMNGPTDSLGELHDFIRQHQANS